MPTLVFDIETTAQPLENFDEVQQEYLLREAEKIPDEAARATKREEIIRMFSLWPLTGHVVCIAMLNSESQRGQVLYTAEDFDEDSAEGGPVELACADCDGARRPAVHRASCVDRGSAEMPDKPLPTAPYCQVRC